MKVPFVNQLMRRKLLLMAASRYARIWTGLRADFAVNTGVVMRLLLPAFVVLSALQPELRADSVPVRSLPDSRRQFSAIRQMTSPEIGSSCIAGDLGKSLARTDRPPRLNSHIPRKPGIPAGSLVRFSDPWPMGAFYPSHTVSSSLANALSDIFVKTLFERKPKGPRGRREQAEAAARK